MYLKLGLDLRLRLLRLHLRKKQEPQLLRVAYSLQDARVRQEHMADAAVRDGDCARLRIHHCFANRYHAIHHPVETPRATQ